MKIMRWGTAAAMALAIIAAASAAARAQVVVVTTGRGKHAHAHIVRPRSFATSPTSNAAVRRAARVTARQGTASRSTTRGRRVSAGSSQRRGADLRTVMNQLNLDDTQQKQFAALENAANAGGKAAYDNKTLSPAQAAAEMETVRQKEIDGINAMLTPAQKSRFHTLLSAADRR